MTFSWGKLGYTHPAYIYLDFITYSLLFANSCFNPIALHCRSSILRNYFNQYLFFPPTTHKESDYYYF
jgi:hypothetical protein